MANREIVIDGVTYLRKDIAAIDGRVMRGEDYWYINDSGYMAFTKDLRNPTDDFRFNNKNYYTTQEACREALLKITPNTEPEPKKFREVYMYVAEKKEDGRRLPPFIYYSNERDFEEVFGDDYCEDEVTMYKYDKHEELKNSIRCDCGCLTWNSEEMCDYCLSKS